MADVDTAALRARAEAVDPGAWGQGPWEEGVEVLSQTTTDYLKAVDPETVLALLDAHDRLAARCAELEAWTSAAMAERAAIAVENLIATNPVRNRWAGWVPKWLRQMPGWRVGCDVIGW